MEHHECCILDRTVHEVLTLRSQHNAIEEMYKPLDMTSEAFHRYTVGLRPFSESKVDGLTDTLFRDATVGASSEPYNVVTAALS